VIVFALRGIAGRNFVGARKYICCPTLDSSLPLSLSLSLSLFLSLSLLVPSDRFLGLQWVSKLRPTRLAVAAPQLLIARLRFVVETIEFRARARWANCARKNYFMPDRGRGT